MEQYRELLEKVARQDLRSAILWSLILAAVIGAIWICQYLNSRKLKAQICRSQKKKQKAGKMLRQSVWAAIALTGFCLILGAVLWGSTVQMRRDIQRDLEQNAYVTYSGSCQIRDGSYRSKYTLFNRWVNVDFEDGNSALLPVNSPLEWFQTEYGPWEGTVVYGDNSLIVVDMQE